MLEELPEYFGQLRSLRHLDLYSNRLEKLPVSFASLKNLKWLDLKNNPLVSILKNFFFPSSLTNRQNKLER
jgi:Leucine-rich repeat (LRR) protein